MISTVAGDSNAHMYAVLIKQQVDARQIQFMALSVSEHELRSVDLGKLAGHLAARNTSSLSSRSKRRVHQNVDGVQRTTGHDHQRSKGGDLHRFQDAGSGGQPSRHGRCRGGPASHVRTTRKGRQVVLSW